MRFAWNFDPDLMGMVPGQQKKTGKKCVFEIVQIFVGIIDFVQVLKSLQNWALSEVFHTVPPFWAFNIKSFNSALCTKHLGNKTQMESFGTKFH